MVYRRALEKIDALKERPHHERRAIAAALALGVVAVLFLGWAVVFFRSISSGEPVADIEVDYMQEFQDAGAAARAELSSSYDESIGALIKLQTDAAAAAAASGQFDAEGYQIVPAEPF